MGPYWVPNTISICLYVSNSIVARKFEMYNLYVYIFSEIKNRIYILFKYAKNMGGSFISNHSNCALFSYPLPSLKTEESIELKSKIGFNSHLILGEYPFYIGFLTFRLLLVITAEDMEESS